MHVLEPQQADLQSQTTFTITVLHVEQLQCCVWQQQLWCVFDFEGGGAEHGLYPAFGKTKLVWMHPLALTLALLCQAVPTY